MSSPASSKQQQQQQQQDATVEHDGDAVEWDALREYQRSVCERLDLEEEEVLRLALRDARAALAAPLLSHEGQPVEEQQPATAGTENATGKNNSNILPRHHDDEDHHQPLAVEEDEELASPVGSSSGVFRNNNSGSPLSLTAEEKQRLRTRRELLSRTIPREFLVQYLEERRTSVRLIGSFILFIPLLFLTLNLAVFRRGDLMETATFSQSLRSHLIDREIPPQGFHNNTDTLDANTRDGGPDGNVVHFGTLRSVADWSRWLQRVAVPFYYDPLHRTISPSRDGPLGQSVLASPIRLRTLRVSNQSCTVPQYLTNLNALNTYGSIPCFARLSEDNILTPSSQTFFVGGVGGEEMPFFPIKQCGGYTPFLMKSRGQYDSYPCGGYTLFLNGSLTFDDALSRTDGFLASGVLSDAATRFIGVDVVLYHTALDVFVVLEALSEVTSGGSWINTARITPVQLPSSTFAYRPCDRASDAFLAIFVIIHSAIFFSGWLASYRADGSVLSYAFDTWTVMNALSLVCISVGLVLQWVVADVSNRRMTSGDFHVPERGDAFPDVVVWCSRCMQLQEYFLCFATIALLLKTMEYLRLNSRLNLLTQTLHRIAEAAVGLMVVFCFFVVAFSLSGYVLYGTSMLSYSQVTRAFATSMLSLMGKFDYPAMLVSDKSLTFIYFWSFIILGLFVLLNFFTAMISTAFDDQRNSAQVLPLSYAVSRIRDQWLSREFLRNQWHLYLRCVKAYHTLSPHILWSPICERVELAVALDRLLYNNASRFSPHGKKAVDGSACDDSMATDEEWASLNDAAATGGGIFSAMRIPLVGYTFFEGSMNREDLAVFTTTHLEDIFMSAVRAHDRLVPSNDTVTHWTLMTQAEGAVDEAIEAFLKSRIQARVLDEKAKRLIYGGSSSSGGATAQAPRGKRTSVSGMSTPPLPSPRSVLREACATNAGLVSSEILHQTTSGASAAARSSFATGRDMEDDDDTSVSLLQLQERLRVINTCAQALVEQVVA